MIFPILMIYLAGVSAIVKGLSAFATFATATGIILLIAIWIDNSSDEEAVIKFKKWIKSLIFGFTASAFVLIFTPSEKTFYMLAGADVAGQVVDKANPVLNKTLKLIETKIDEELQGKERKQNGK